ncbi:MAG: DUF1566 domain-containing protein [Thermodesulfobacteriota bacterium]
MARMFSRSTGSCLRLLLTLFLVVALGQVSTAAAAGSFVKIDASGNELPPDAAGWAMVKDTETGLFWEVKTTDGSVHDAGRQYSWKEANGVFLAELNTTRFGGFDDWRMPNDTEIASIMRQDKEEPFVDTTFFANVRAANYWNFYICGSGAIMSDTKSFGKKSVRAAKQHVMAVRGGCKRARKIRKFCK